MKSRMIIANKLAGFLAVGVFALGMPMPTAAQGRPGPPSGGMPSPSEINPKREDRARHDNEVRLRTAGMEAGAEAENQKRIQAAITNMKQDFTRIQVLRNDIARNLVARKPLDHNLITQQTAEINKRAHRLNVYMLAHAPEIKEENNLSDLKSEEMVGALVKLCKLIDSFTENPALKNAATINVKETERAKDGKAKADADLLAIIKLSEIIQKKSDSLRVPK